MEDHHTFLIHKWGIIHLGVGKGRLILKPENSWGQYEGRKHVRENEILINFTKELVSGANSAQEK